MAVYDLEEQEQLSELRTWWKINGNRVLMFVAALALGSVGYQGWNWYQRSQAAEASMLYAKVRAAASAGDAKAAREAAGELIGRYSRTAYAGLGVLLAAKAQYEAGDVKNAQAELAWAAEHSPDPGLGDVARLRLAGLLAEQKAYDDALRRLGPEPVAPLAGRYAELKGDIYAAQGKAGEARSAYRSAMALSAEAKGEAASTDEARRTGESLRERVQIKLDALGE
ncbi:MAG: tetratricopeptide repeat protein [Rhodocyclaceae bacterium]